MVYDRDKGRCRLCGKEVHPLDFEVGHNKPHSRGGKLTLRNALLLHPVCNRSMRTNSLKQAKGSIGITSEEDEAKAMLKSLKVSALRYLAKNHHVSVKGTASEGLFSSSYSAPSKAKYISALAKVMKAGSVQKELKGMPPPKKRKRKKESWLFGW